MFYLRAWDNAETEDATEVQAGSARLRATAAAESEYARDISLTVLPSLDMIGIYRFRRVVGGSIPLVPDGLLTEGWGHGV